MNSISNRSARWATVLAGLALAVSAVGVGAHHDGAVGVEVSGLASGDVVTGNELALTVAPVGYEFTPVGIGKGPADTVSHYHIVLDGALINAFVRPDPTVSLQNVAPGGHNLLVVPATNDHSNVMDGATSIDFDYQPEAPLAEITTAAEPATGAPAITIVSPAAGDTVSGPVEVVVEATGLELSGDLFGKANIDGIGHWHSFIDEVNMPHLTGMSGSDTMTISSAGLEPGTHTIFAVLVDNLHAPFDPPIVTRVEVEIAADGDTSGAAGGIVTVSLQEWRLEPAEITLAAGTYTFAGTNDGSFGHALALVGEDISAATADLAYSVGTTQSFTVDLAPGAYEIFCPVAGHKQAGMVATVTVTG